MNDNPEMARIIGIDTIKVSLLAFALGSAIAAVPAVLILLKEGATPYMGFTAVFMAFVAVVVGGIGSLPRPVLRGLPPRLLQHPWPLNAPTQMQHPVPLLRLLPLLPL